MDTIFFPTHLAVGFYVLTAVTGLVFWWLFTGAGQDSREALFPGRSLRAGLLMGGWYVLALFMAGRGLLTPGGGLPLLPLAVVLPVVIGIALLWRPASRRRVDAVSPALWAGVHGLRIPFGVMFLALYEMEAIPGEFAFRGGYGDIAAGLLGLLSAWLLTRKTRSALTPVTLAVFSLVGLGDFALVLYTGLTLLDPAAPFAAFHPFQMVPAFVVPLFILAHIIVLRRVVWGGVQASQPKEALNGQAHPVPARP